MLPGDDQTLTPQSIVNDYSRAFQQLNGQPPSVRHMGGPWYMVNGETVHRIMLLGEIQRLNEELALKRTYTPPQRSVVQRLIARLRGI